MKKRYLYSLLVLLMVIPLTSFKNKDQDQVLVMAKILELKAFQKILLSEPDLKIVTNGLLDESIYLKAGEREIPTLSSASKRDKEFYTLSFKKFELNEKFALVKMTGTHSKIRVKLRSEGDEWVVQSYFIKNYRNTSIYTDI